MANNKQIAKNIVFNSLSFGINLVISFFLTPYLIKTVGKEAYSFFPLVNNMLGYTEILTATIGSMAGRFITMAYYQGDQEETKGYFNSAITAYLAFSSLFCVIGIFVLIFIDSILNIPDGLIWQVQILFGLAVLGSCVNLCTYLFGIGTYVKNRLDLRSIFELIKKAFYLLLLFSLFALFKPTIIYISVASFAATLLGVSINFYFKKRFLPEITFRPLKYFSWKKIRTLLNSGVWMSVNSLSNILCTSIDLLLTNIFISAAATGDFSISKVVPTFIASLSGVVGGTFTANFNILYAQKKYDELLHEIKKSMVIISFLISVPIGYFMVNSDYFFQLWVSSAFTQDMVWLSLIALLLSATGYSTNSIYGVYTITDKRKIPSFALLAAGLLNSLLLFFFLKYTSMGVYGIAISSAISLGLRNVIFTPIYGARCLNLKPTIFYPFLLKGFVGIAIVAIIAYVSRFFMQEVTWLTFVINGVLVCSLAMVANYFYFLRKDERTYLWSVVQAKLPFFLKHNK